MQLSVDPGVGVAGGIEPETFGCSIRENPSTVDPAGFEHYVELLRQGSAADLRVAAAARVLQREAHKTATMAKAGLGAMYTYLDNPYRLYAGGKNSMAPEMELQRYHKAWWARYHDYEREVAKAGKTLQQLEEAKSRHRAAVRAKEEAEALVDSARENRNQAGRDYNAAKTNTRNSLGSADTGMSNPMEAQKAAQATLKAKQANLQEAQKTMSKARSAAMRLKAAADRKEISLRRYLKEIAPIKADLEDETATLYPTLNKTWMTKGEGAAGALGGGGAAAKFGGSMAKMKQMKTFGLSFDCSASLLESVWAAANAATAALKAVSSEDARQTQRSDRRRHRANFL